MKRAAGGIRTTFLTLLGLALGLSITACANPSHADDADDLAETLRGLADVRRVTLRYSEPITLDSGKISLAVTMSDGADPDRITAVVDTAYEAFRSTHHDEEADLEVAADDDVLALRSFQPSATTQAVVAAARAPLTFAADTAVDATVMTQDVDAAPHVSTTTTLTLPDGTTASDVLAQFGRIETAFDPDPLRHWAVRAADTSGLGTDSPYPTAATLDLWRQLRAESRGLGRGAAVFLQDDPDRKTPLRFVEVELGDVDPYGDAATVAPIVAAAQRQIDLIRLDGDGWSYTLTKDGEQISLIDPNLCDPARTLNDTENPVDDALRTPANCPSPPAPDADR